ncbi:MAG TPA: M55 family metallopeptidase, partial [Steroidobacteraceae bacterium]|nr:M55 family metallopeptidase [Steroidobacteraceae bacterium]
MKLAVFGIAGLIASSIVPAATPSRPATSAPFKVYISVDMEGVAGTVTADQLVPAGFEYERFRRFMTDEALAA